MLSPTDTYSRHSSASPFARTRERSCADSAAGLLGRLLKRSVVQEHVPGRLLSLWSASSLKNTGCPSNPLPMFKGNGGPLPGLPLWCALRHQSYHCYQVSLALLDRGRRKSERVNWLVTTSCPRHSYGFNRITAFSAHWCAFSQTNEKTQTIL